MTVIKWPPTVRKTEIVHRVKEGLVPAETKDKILQAAIALVWMYENGSFMIEGDIPYNQKIVDDVMEELTEAVNEATKYAVPVERTVEEPLW